MEDIAARLASFILPLLPGLAVGYLLGRFARHALSTALGISFEIGLAKGQS